ncbi:cell wall-binding repeat-containing protein [Desulfosporosinus sp. PR]|uniref:cell wall-binding repeat-containing protein n=1 Tax=Candidatus Desulfosporosinus nitrosoreducens TaxID=3401928 RepID=UPI0027F8A992|nr:cell wall-binding repeat-containing protein [Desulfosporosinus sp. PR]MDQ7093926.1 cell wall-binding repeat-containing protein [Desulfosporosinus sp. PR]
MGKMKKAMASLAIAVITLSIIPFQVFADDTAPTRLAGATAAQTAAAIADQTGYSGVAILASSTSYGMVDALTAGPLAVYLKAPILLTGAGETLDADTKAELSKLKVTTVYVTSGTFVISQAVLDELTGMGITVVPLGGMDSAETAVNIAKKMSGVTKVAVVNGIPDALSIAAIASAANEPILLTDKDSLPASVSAYLAANPGITASDVIGGTGVISDAVKGQLPNATRHAGMTSYDTNNQVIQDFASQLQFSKVFVANGETGIDALAGAPLAAQTKSPIVLTNGTIPAAASFVRGKLAGGAVVTALGGAAVVPEAVRTGVQIGQVNPSNGPLAVTSVTAVAADSFKVVFNRAPADTSKVTFDVENFSTPMTVTATWDSGNTEATLQNSANFPQGTYTVAVKDDTTDLGKTSVTVDQQKIAAINITATKLGVVTNSKDNSQTGYATYQVLDQYGNDITTSGLANSLSFQSGVGSVDAKDGLLTLDSNVQNLMQFSTVVITGYDSTSGVSTSATLTTSTQIGTLSDFQFGQLTNADDKELTDGDSSVFYASYTAKDISGNLTTDYHLILGGLILHSDANGNDNLLSTSNSYVTASVEEDPSDSTKAVIKVIVNNTSGDSISVDMPTVITAMTWTGTTSTLNTTLNKASKLDSFRLMAPSYNIASGESKVIPFAAYDQNGTQLTKYSDLQESVSGLILTNCILQENADGTASILNKPFANNSTQSVAETLSASTSTGKFSNLTINIQKPAQADTLVLNPSVLLTNMQNGANQFIDFGINYGGLAVKDQYDRVFDMIGKATEPDLYVAGALAAPAYDYEVLATTADSSELSLTGTDIFGNAVGDPAASGAKGICIQAAAANAGNPTGAGSGTVVFNLVNARDGHAGTATDPHVVIDSKSITISVLADKDIKDYAIAPVPNPLYAVNDNTAISELDKDYAANPYVYGTTSSGAKVKLKGNPVVGVSVDSKDFSVVDSATSAPIAYDKVKVVANKLADNVTESSTTLSVSLQGADGLIHSLTTPLKSSSATRASMAIVIGVGTYLPGNSLNETGDVATIAQNWLAAGKILARFDKDGAVGTYGPTGNGYDPTPNLNIIGRAGLYFLAVDQYGSKGMPLAKIILDSAVDANGNPSQFRMDPDGTITNDPNVGDVLKLTGVTTSGLVKSIEIHVAATDPTYLSIYTDTAR